MLSKTDLQIAKTFKKKLDTITPVLELRVFGSRARGDASSDSDLDVFIEVETLTKELRMTISEIAWEIGFAADRLISTIVMTRDQIENGPMGANPLLIRIQQEGIAL